MPKEIVRTMTKKVSEKVQRATTKKASTVNLAEQIRVAAYLRAEARGFAPGLETMDWIEAEAEIKKRT